MRLVFAGTPEVAVVSLLALLDSEHEVLAVVTRPDAVAGRYDLLLANILATPLKLLAPLLSGLLQRGGQLVLAGILERQADELSRAYAPWLTLQVADSVAGWVLMTGTRAAEA